MDKKNRIWLKKKPMGRAFAPANFSGPAPGGAFAPASFLGPAPGGAFAPAKLSGPAPGGALPGPPRL